MQQFLSLFPKGFLAFVVILGGILFIIFSDPPKTVCDAQLEVFKKSQGRFLYKDPKSKVEKTTLFDRLFEHCKSSNNPGGCLELFQLTNRMLDDLVAVPEECRDKAIALTEVKKVISLMPELLVRLAWGSAPPQTYAQKMGWLDVSDISLYCRLKDRYESLLGDNAWANLREKLLKDLPSASNMQRSQAWDLSILSENCARYP